MIAAGTQLGAYEIVAPLGAGGMGEVYLARDTRLGREVAIKVLPAAFAADAGRLKRFEKEARAASALNHPNVVTIYEIGSSGSISYIAMERVDGKTLRELLSAGPVPTKTLLEIAIQIVEGLARAHEAGIVHRDLKPENVMVAKDGLVKILDFRLAKLTHPESDDGSELPTVSLDTRAGVVLGTIGYMSPQQAAGEPIDFRSDQFSFGSVLYEMTTGKRAFARRSAPETLAAIIREEPESVGTIVPGSPVPLRWIVERCLAKEPRERYASTMDLALDLKSVRGHSSGVVPVSAREPGLARKLLPVALLVAGFLAFVGLFAVVRSAKRSSTPHFQQLTFRRGAVLSARFTPDGQSVVYSARWDERPTEIFSGLLGSPESRPLDLKARLLSVSSTGVLAVLFPADATPIDPSGTLAQVSLSGGAPRVLLNGVFGADWSPDGKEFAVVGFSKRFALEFPAGNVLYQTAGSISYPRVSQDGTLVAFVEQPSTLGLLSVAVVDRNGKARALSTGYADVRGLAWSPRGDEIWFSAAASGNARTLRAVTLSGKERIIYEVPEALDLQDISRDGKVLAVHSIDRSGVIGRRAGQAERDLSWLDGSESADLSGDGKTVLFGERGRGGGAGSSIYVRGTDGSPAVRLGSGTPLALSPDGKWVLALSQKPTSLSLLPTGAGAPQRVPHPGLVPLEVGAAFFPDGRRILFAAEENGHERRSFVEDLREGRPQPVTPSGVLAWAVSPDGLFVAGSGPTEPNLWRYPAEGGQREPMPVLLQPGDWPLGWSGDGKFFLLSNLGVPGRVFRVDLSSGARSLWKELMPVDPSGLFAVEPNRFSSDGESYVHTYLRRHSDLFLIEGLR